MFATMWRKSSYSQSPTSDCVEVAFSGVDAAVRDSKNASGPVLEFGERAWREFIGQSAVVIAGSG